MKTVKIRKITTNSRLLRGAASCLNGKYLPAASGSILVPFDGTASYVKIDGERVECKAPGKYWLRSAFYHQRNERRRWLSTSNTHPSDGPDIGVNFSTLGEILVVA